MIQYLILRRILAEDVAKLKTKFNWSNDLYTTTLSFLNKKTSDAINKHEETLKKNARKNVLYSRNNARIASRRTDGTILSRPTNGGAVR